MLNVQNCVNPTENCVHQMYEFFGLVKKIEYLELRKFNGKLCSIYVRTIWIYREFEFCGYVECLELRKSSGKLCTLDVRLAWICRKFVYPELC